MQTNWNTRKITREEITLHEWLTMWMTNPTQRDHVKRAKSPSFKKKMKNRTPKHTEVDGVTVSYTHLTLPTNREV